MNNNKLCLWCISPLIKRHSQKYCNNKCQNKYEYMNSFLDWYFCKKKIIRNNMIRQHLETMNGYKCSECGITQWNSKPITLDVDHVNGNSSDNKPENVRFLCKNCHSQTETFANCKSGTGRYLLHKKGII